MIPIRRAALPPEIDTRMADLTGRIRAAPEDVRAKTARGLWRQRDVRTAVADPLRTVLRRMAPGNERCMYCGDSAGTDIDHHEPMAHNPLRTFDWLNHLLACSHCNSHEKREHFPLDEFGRPLLIDPTMDDPFDHISLSLSLGEYHALTEKGHRTIEVCGLNRPVLVRARYQSLHVMVLCLRQWPATVRGESAYEIPALVRIIREQPCADVFHAMLRQAELPGAAAIFALFPDVVDLLRDSHLRGALLRPSG